MYDRFKALAEDKGVSAYKIAKDLGFSQSLFSDWKAGRSRPKQDKIIKIAYYFSVPVEYFYGEEVPAESGVRLPYRVPGIND